MWETVMGENYVYAVTRASEEAIELLGYTLIFLGAIEYSFALKKSYTKQIESYNTSKIKNQDRFITL